MEREEFVEKTKSLYEAMKKEQFSKLEEYVGFDEIERQSNWYLLFIALSKFIEDET